LGTWLSAGIVLMSEYQGDQGKAGGEFHSMRGAVSGSESGRSFGFITGVRQHQSSGNTP
jgi:hypothetical protein